jgi:hypothetical protein
MDALDRATGAEPFRVKPAPGWSADLGRILTLPRRPVEGDHTQTDVDALEATLRRKGPCVCAAQGRPCPTHLRPAQSHALIELPATGGGIGCIGVGHGKTLLDLLLPMVFPGCKVAVLLIPASLRAQLLDRDWAYYGGHWKLPNLVGGFGGFVAGRPALHVITYSKLSRPEFAVELRNIRPDLVIADECHNLKSLTGPRAHRFATLLEELRPRFVGHSGSVATRSIRDAAHLFGYALGDGSPYPRVKHVVEEWAPAVDPCTCAALTDDDRACVCKAPPGALSRLGEGNVREAFRRRRNETRGVISTRSASFGGPIVIRTREIPVPFEVAQMIAAATHRDEAVRPDGEVLVDGLAKAECAKQLAAGFFHRWRYPRQEPPELIDAWFDRRQEFNRELRELLKYPQEHLDSPKLAIEAAIRAWSGYRGSLPTWRAQAWPAWLDISDKVVHVTEAKWESDFLVNDVAERAHTGDAQLVWVGWPELGERIARAAKLPWIGGGPAMGEALAREKGDRSVVISIKSRATGTDGLQAKFNRNLVVTPPEDWQQLLGRTHRPGQRRDEVEAEVYLHTAEYRDAFAKARERARFVEETDGEPQKLQIADYEWPVT